MFHILEIKGEEYKLKLSAMAIVNLEKKIGCNPLDIIIKVENGQIPQLGQMIDIIHFALQKYQHNFKYENTVELVENFLEENSIIELLPHIVEIFKVSGFFK